MALGGFWAAPRVLGPYEWMKDAIRVALCSELQRLICQTVVLL